MPTSRRGPTVLSARLHFHPLQGRSGAPPPLSSHFRLPPRKGTNVDGRRKQSQAPPPGSSPTGPSPCGAMVGQMRHRHVCRVSDDTRGATRNRYGPHRGHRSLPAGHIRGRPQPPVDPFHVTSCLSFSSAPYFSPAPPPACFSNSKDPLPSPTFLRASRRAELAGLSKREGHPQRVPGFLAYGTSFDALQHPRAVGLPCRPGVPG